MATPSMSAIDTTAEEGQVFVFMVSMDYKICLITLTSIVPPGSQATSLVKEWNTEELENYANLVTRGNPDFI